MLYRLKSVKEMSIRYVCFLLNINHAIHIFSLGYLFFSSSPTRAGSVIESPCPFVCMCVIKVVIVYNGKSIRFFGLSSSNRVGMYGSKKSKSRRTSKCNDQFKTMFFVHE